MSSSYFSVKSNGLSQAQTMAAYLGGSAFQTILDNPITAYRQFVQQNVKNAQGVLVDPKVARMETNKIFLRNPIGASMSGLGPRLIGVGFKRIPKFWSLLFISYVIGENGEIGLVAATGASIMSAPFINPVRMIEKQQRSFLKATGQQISVFEVIKRSQKHNFLPLFRGTLPLMGHSLASATTGLAGQPQLEKYIRGKLGDSGYFGKFACGLIASSMVTPIYVLMTNPLSRLEVIMQTSSIDKKPISFTSACKELAKDSAAFGLRGAFRGQGLGIVKGIISLTSFHQGRIFLSESFKDYNESNGLIPSTD